MKKNTICLFLPYRQTLFIIINNCVIINYTIGAFMKYVYLGIYLIFTTIHLYASLKNNKELRNVTKGFILFTLLGFYLEAVDILYWAVVVAILFSLLGDLLLIPHGTKWFALGGVAFMASHAFFIVSYINYTDFNLVPLYVIIPFALLFLGAVIFIFYRLKPFLPKALFYPMALYLLINGAMNCFAIYRLFSNPTAGAIITVVGALLFFVSDTSLFFVRFNKNSIMKSHFLVMLTYSIGEFLIILGLILI